MPTIVAAYAGPKTFLVPALFGIAVLSITLGFYLCGVLIFDWQLPIEIARSLPK